MSPLYQKIEECNELLRKWFAEDPRKVGVVFKGVGKVYTGFKTQAVIKAVNMVFGPEGWKYDVLDESEHTATIAISLRDPETKEWLPPRIQHGDSAFGGDKGALTNALSKTFSTWSIGDDPYLGLVDIPVEDPKDKYVKPLWGRARIIPWSKTEGQAAEEIVDIAEDRSRGNSRDARRDDDRYHDAPADLDGERVPASDIRDRRPARDDRSDSRRSERAPRADRFADDEDERSALRVKLFAHYGDTAAGMLNGDANAPDAPAIQKSVQLLVMTKHLGTLCAAEGIGFRLKSWDLHPRALEIVKGAEPKVIDLSGLRSEDLRLLDRRLADAR